jgi:hypothetical protein
VIPGSSPTIARRDPISRLKSVDLPTLGRPTMAKVGMADKSKISSDQKLLLATGKKG